MITWKAGSELWDRLDALRAGYVIGDLCPSCGRKQWWDCSRGWDKCWDSDCGFVVELYPQIPKILCSRCGGNLKPSKDCHRCEPCSREVRP